jgi:flagellar hook-length control protein FliK
VFSVTSEAASNVSLQAARQKSERPDASQPNDGFMALVDSSIAVDSGSDGAKSASHRRAKDVDSADDKRSRSDPASRTVQTVKSASDDRDSSAQETSGLNASADPKATAVERPPPKPARSKHDAELSTETALSDTNDATDPDGPAQQLESSLAAPNAMAVAIPVATVFVDVPGANPAIGGAAAPVAIAAAGIAPSAPAASVPVAPTAQTNIDPDAAGSASLTAAPPLTDIALSALAANVNATAASTATASTGVAQQAAPAAVGKSTAQTDALLAAPELPVADATAPSPVTTAVLGPQLPASQKNSVSGTSDAKLDKPDPAENSTQALSAQPNLVQLATAKPEAANDLADAPKSDRAGNASPAPLPVPAVHDHSPVTTAAHALSASTEAGSAITGALPPQLPPAPAISALAGSLSVTAASNAPIPLSGLAVEIAASVRSGKSHFEIRLDPADLGRIDVRIDVDRDGQITSHLRVEKPETLLMLRQDAPQLQRALDDAGFKSGDGGLQFSLRDQSSSGRNNGNETSRNAQHLVIRDDDAIPAVVAGRSYGRLLGSSSGVDIRV